ncbi:MAG: glycosyltransferase [Clostridia bacterium]|nr:glycosyltransferase [Clostridia bacterium]
MTQPLLSIGMIVKNEERCLEKCLKALTPLRQAIPCELVIADTGSTDTTKQIAEKYADILFDFVWKDDFSKARNAVMDKCSGKWYLSIDADEYLNSSVDELCNFLKSASSDDKSFATITLRNHNDSSMNGTFTVINVPRLVKMSTKIRYEGIIHESFKIFDFNEIHVLSETIFDHDGYTQITSTHLKEKEKRNLNLLEKQLENTPHDIRCILLCLEASSLNKSKRKHYTEYAFQKLTEAAETNSSDLNLFGPACISTALSYALDDKNAKFVEFADWAISTFPDAYHTLVDIKFYIAKYYYQKNNFADCEKYCIQYLNGLKDFSDKGNTNIDSIFASPLKCTQSYSKTELLTYLINSLIEQNKHDEAENYLSQLDFSEAEAVSFTVFSKTLANKNCTKSFVSAATSIYNNFFNKYQSNEIKEKRIYDYAIASFIPVFSAKNNNENDLTNFNNIDGTIGLSAKISNSQTKESTEKLLKKIENWEEFMPSALKQAILLQVELPKGFYLMSASHLTLLINDLAKSSNELSDTLIKNFCNDVFCNSFPQTSFIYNLLLAILTKTDETLTNEAKSELIKNFIYVADKFLTFCYNPELLKSEEIIVCIPTFHLFSWYLVKAESEKAENPLEYIKTLRVLLKKIPQSKKIVEFLIEEYKKDEEQRKQEQIKNAAPELLQMAEQLKVMLSAFPENSPELLAIKQSPMYKQVAFLIEDK